MRARELLGLFVVLLGLLFGSLARAAADCRPAPFGDGSAIVSSDSVNAPHADGVWSYWRCPDAFMVRTRYELRRHEHRLQLPDVAGLTLAQAFDALIVANRDTPYEAPALAGLRAAAEAHAAAHRPPVPRWVVAKNGTTTTRPVYLRNADGTRATTALAGVRATVGAPCSCADPARRVGDGTGSTYCDPRAVTPVVVTLCARAAP